MKVVVTADFHGYLPPLVPECDLLLIAGDVCPVWDHERKYQMDWLRYRFSPWLHEQPAKEIVWVGGNHDFVLEEARRSKIDLIGGTYLHNESVELLDHKIWGSPFSPTFGGWAFMKDDPLLFDIWETIPEDTEILVVHGPPKGYGDLTAGYMGSPPVQVGSETLRYRIDNLPNLKLVACGHIHPAYGQYVTMKGVIVINGSHVNEKYQPVYRPFVVEL